MVGNECIYKKCSDQCVEGLYEFDYGGQTYTRNRYCCNDQNYSNAATRMESLQTTLLFLTGALAAYLLIM